MTIVLNNFASGDTDYISKMNSNVSEITAAINALQAAAGGGGPGTAVSAGLFMDALFNQSDCLIGPESFVVTQHASTVSVAPGTLYMADQKTVVASYAEQSLNFAAQTARQYYIVVGGGGIVNFRTTLEPGSIYSVVWAGTGVGFLGDPTRICACFYDATEATASRMSTVMGEDLSPTAPLQYDTLDDRLEATEEIAIDAKDIADDVLAIVQLGGIRKVGLTVDGSGSVISPGVKGIVQLDYAGTIVGWSIVGDVVGSITVEVQKKASSPPPAAPGIPNTTTDKISASAPIAISSAQSAAGGESQVATWNTDIVLWDVVQFTVTAVTTITRATLYLRIREVPPLGVATGAIAGTPGTWVPLGADVPADLAAMGSGVGGVDASPSFPWVAGQHMVLGDASQCYWTGTAWANGVAP